VNASVQQTVVRMAQGYQLSQALYVAAELGVADAPAAGLALGDATALPSGPHLIEAHRV
jgi:hypothetical protein